MNASTNLCHSIEGLLSYCIDRQHKLYDVVALTHLLDRIDQIGDEVIKGDDAALYELHNALFVLNEKDAADYWDELLERMIRIDMSTEDVRSSLAA